jgi:methylase of polypeptide subunit release factors
MSIYFPAEDSYFFSETLKEFLKNKNKKIKILDMGSGSGIQAGTCKKNGFKNILAADINSEAVRYIKKQKTRPASKQIKSHPIKSKPRSTTTNPRRI